jgi:hypothetical protein
MPTAVVLDWRDRSHYARRAARCRYCPGRTHLRDDTGRPAHKTCAETALTHAAAAAAGGRLA